MASFSGGNHPAILEKLLREGGEEGGEVAERGELKSGFLEVGEGEEKVLRQSFFDLNDALKQVFFFFDTKSLFLFPSTPQPLPLL